MIFRNVTPVLLIKPNGDAYDIAGVLGALNFKNQTPVVLVKLDGTPYEATGGGGGGSGFADQGRASVSAGDLFVDITFAVTGTDPIPTVLYTTWGTAWYPTAITTTGFRANFFVECPTGGGTVAWAYTEA